MLRKLAIAGVAGIVGYVVGVKAGFDTGVRDYIENDGELLERVARQKDKFDYTGEEEEDGGTFSDFDGFQ